MDIAEIRKKAKKQGQTETPAAPSNQEIINASQGSPAQPAEPVYPDPSTEPVVDHAPGAVAAQDHSDGLDRLFAITEEFALTINETYDNILDSQSDAQSQSARQYLAFHLGNEEYALDITRISEIIKVREFTDIPRAPKFILGIISLRGVVVPVFDLRLRLNLGVSEMLPTSRIVVSQLDDMKVGLLVDSINQVVNLSDEDLEPPPGVLSGLDREMIDGIGRCQERMIILLDLKNVLSAELN